MFLLFCFPFFMINNFVLQPSTPVSSVIFSDISKKKKCKDQCRRSSFKKKNVMTQNKPFKYKM